MKKLPLLIFLFSSWMAAGRAQPAPLTTVTPATPATAGAPARNPAVPVIVTNGFDAYQKSGSQAALDAWFKGSPLESDQAAKGNLSVGISKTESVFGKMLGWELFKAVPLTASTTVVYTVIKFEKGPLWMAFYCYRQSSASDWVVYSLGVDSNPTKVLPPGLMGGS
jgi:hypothetical protein